MSVDSNNTVMLRKSRHQRVMSGPKLTQKEGRVCRVESCETRLSRYNPSETCRLHEGWRDGRMRRHD
ncbi:hypothetical protein ER308_01470 [Egibacter rhizosphaerae]|uniref:Uncharacterized protein n=1 Tax=Egibacter rhizosphaerae TaxID=1670831 RepID=A0A411YAY0_9ACTN|nr:hypothetical protein [Egibacter rhizosphaerae]QBI18370.1 hypothetical protein ER308_01470 [Egibacter rhizosphaerae]